VPDNQIQIQVNLSGLPDRMQRVLQAAINFVAIGLNSAPSITTDSFAIPDIQTQHEFGSNNPWTADQAKQAWTTWILRNGFRDVAEAISGTLEEVQKVLSCWHVAELQKARGSLLGKDVHTLVVQRGQRFHKHSLPQKIEFLEKNYSFTLDSDLLEQINTFRIARNCLAHRGGVITKVDANVDGALEVRWTALVVLVVSDGKEVELNPPHTVEPDSSLAIGKRTKSKRLAIGQQVDFTPLEFAQMCWTCFVFAQSCADRLKDYGTERGVQFGQSAT
jgi:hypothetical protein